jgi:hypothetical protein
MARACSICARPDAGEVAVQLASGRSVRSVAAEFGLSDDALGRHAKNHLGRPAWTSATIPAPADGSLDPLDELVAALRTRALAGNPSDTREYRLALAAQAATRHATAPTRPLADSEEWIALRTAMLAALEPFPEARLAIADALEGLG